MIYPDLKSEKAISMYSIKLVDNIEKNTHIESLSYQAGKPLTLFKSLYKLKRYDIIHIQHEYNLLGFYGVPFFLLFCFLILLNKRVVITMHTVLSIGIKLRGNKIKVLFRKLLYLTQNFFIKMVSNSVIVHANFFKDILVTDYKLSPRQINVIPQGIIENIPKTEKDVAKRELNLSGPVYLIIGSFVPDHGADKIIKQANRIGGTVLIATNSKSVNDRNNKRIREYLELNKSIVNHRQLYDSVRFDIKEIPFSLWWKYFSAADIVLLPYIGGIGSGILSDAIAARKPVVASNIKYFREFSEKYGFITIAKKDTDFPKRIKEAMKPDIYKEMVIECDRYIKDYGLSNMGKRYSRLYTSLC